MREREQYGAFSRLPYTSGDDDTCEWSNGEMLISRGKNPGILEKILLRGYFVHKGSHKLARD
jgi:hypothetical protein